MGRRRAAATAHHRDPVLLDETHEPGGELGGPEREVGLAVDELGEARVGDDRDELRRATSQVRDVLAHLLWARRAVEPEDLHVVVRLDRGERSRDVRPDQHRAEGLHRDLRENGHALPELRAGESHSR
jgi:hypothetical protein